jgi:hypothetical protein
VFPFGWWRASRSAERWTTSEASCSIGGLKGLYGRSIWNGREVTAMARRRIVERCMARLVAQPDGILQPC